MRRVIASFQSAGDQLHGGHVNQDVCPRTVKKFAPLIPLCFLRFLLFKISEPSNHERSLLFAEIEQKEGKEAKKKKRER